MAESGSAKEFRVVIEGMEGQEERLQPLAIAVQKAVLNEIAQLKLYDSFQVHLPRDWIGIMIRPPEIFQ